MPAVTTRIWQFTQLAIPLWGKVEITRDTLNTLELRLRRQLDNYAGVSWDYINDGSWVVFTFSSGINEDYRRRILPEIRACLPDDATIRWEGNCVETTVHVGGWVETVSKMDPNRTRE